MKVCVCEMTQWRLDKSNLEEWACACERESDSEGHIRTQYFWLFFLWM